MGRNQFVELEELWPQRQSIKIDWSALARTHADAADKFLDDPAEIMETTRSVISELSGGDITPHQVQVLVENLPAACRVQPHRLRAEVEGKLVAIDCVVRTTTEVRPKYVSVMWRCERCGHQFRLRVRGTSIFEPRDCPNDACDRRGPFTKLERLSEKINAQIIRVQDPLEVESAGQTTILDVELQGDLVATLIPGDKCTVNGIVRTVSKGTEAFQKFYIFGVGVEVGVRDFQEIEPTEDDLREIVALRKDPEIVNRVAASVAPAVSGYGEVKLGVALQLVSSPPIVVGGTRFRGDIHILLVGDPGISKSQILKGATRLAPGGRYTSGKGASSAGLTATVVKDDLGDGRWTWEAGFLVLADRGFAAIDELDKMDPKDRSALHEALEQQQVSISKASVSATLNARCPVLAAANPKSGRFDLADAILPQIDLSPALMSRFDLIFALPDKSDDVRDAAIVDFLAKIRNGETPGVRGQIATDLLRKYISYCRRTVSVVQLTPDATQLIKEYYLENRKANKESGTPVAITARQLESLFRLAAASARLRCSKEVTRIDAKRAVDLVEFCLKTVGFDPVANSVDVDLINLGQAKSTRDRTKQILNIVRDEGPIAYKLLLARLEEEGFSQDAAEKLIQTLETRGDLYRPKNGVLAAL